MGWSVDDPGKAPLPEASWSWISLVLKHPFPVAGGMLVLTICILGYTLRHFQINTNLLHMVSDKFSFQKDYKAFRKAFPQLNDSIVVVIDADAPERAQKAQDEMADGLQKEPGLFRSVYTPGGGTFFRKSGLLYLDSKDLYALGDELATAQPFLAVLSRNFNLSGFFTALGTVTASPTPSEESERRLAAVYEGVSTALESSLRGESYHLSWQEIMLGKAMPQERRRFIVLRPVLDYRRLYPADPAVKAVEGLARSLGFTPENGIRVRVTGGIVIESEDLKSVESGIVLAGILSSLLVGVTLYIGLGSGRLVFASLITLFSGLVWTMGFAIAFVGSLNMISITFAVLFIGLGIDYGIQFCLRFKEYLDSDLGPKQALAETVRSLFKAFLLCTITTAIGFYSFIPTAYTGASQLGLISGTGMFINFLTTLVFLPSLLTLLRRKPRSRATLAMGGKVSTAISRHSKAIVVIAMLAAIGSAALLPRIEFDPNPLDMSNPHAEAVRTAKELFKDSESSPWTISAMTDSLVSANGMAERLRELKEVAGAITISDFVPKGQAQKLDIIFDMALFMPAWTKSASPTLEPLSRQMDALRRFQGILQQHLGPAAVPGNALERATRRLYLNIVRFDQRTETGLTEALKRLEEALLPTLGDLLDNLDASLHPTEFNISDLPAGLQERYVSREGVYRVEVFPQDNISHLKPLEQFVESVKRVAPNATDEPVTILGSEQVIVSAFRQATLWTLAAVTIFLFIVMRNLLSVIYIMIPLLLALMLTGAATVLLGIPLNFANIIVIPLLLGSGVDYGIHLVHRFMEAPPGTGRVLHTSTSRAIFFSALTTIVGFCSLAFSAHRGTASIGILLTLCITFMIVCTLVVLPALLHLHAVRSH
jgi:hopanoid biosynthesis associated RND transporter like protein HpnN